MALQKESRKLHVKMINLSICPTVYCYGHDTDDKMEGKKKQNKTKYFIPESLIQGEYGAPARHSHYQVLS